MVMDTSLEKEPVDPFAGRKRLDLFTPEPHEMRKTWPNEVPAPNSSSTACSNGEAPPKTTENKSVMPPGGSSCPETTAAATSTSALSPQVWAGMLASFFNFTDSKPLPRSKLSRLVLTALVGENPEWRESAAFWAAVRIIDTKTPMKKIDSELAPILKLIRVVQTAGGVLAIPSSIASALWIRRELNNRKMEFVLNTAQSNSSHKAKIKKLPMGKDRIHHALLRRKNAREETPKEASVASSVMPPSG